ncbi:hypothetical protein ANN_07093 [Periplaneta americana]|uniref:Uncharacterized protein n=1 Tax=Periplaneta americana TaxID=6978 RepID=A0ABQ8TFZ2_PERAM|nr:hypothetical protein ANN_07093 [Periplaneta americana]
MVPRFTHPPIKLSTGSGSFPGTEGSQSVVPPTQRIQDRIYSQYVRSKIRSAFSSDERAFNIESFSHRYFLMKSFPILVAYRSKEDQLVRVLEKNTELTIQNTDLQKQVQHLQNVSAEGRSGLPGSVQPGSTSSANRSGDIESILKQMRDAADKRKELEQQHAEALTQLRDKQSELQRLTKFSTSTSSDKKSKSYETIEALQSKIRELEKKTELQNVRHEELLLEMASIKRSSQGSSASATMGPSTSSSTGWKLSRTSSTNQEVQTSPESGTSTPGNLTKGKLKTKRRWWQSPLYESRNQYRGTDLLHDLRRMESGQFHNFCRISETDFEILLCKIDSRVSKKDAGWREAIPIQERLALTLRYLATGDSYTSLMYLFRVSKQLITRIVPEVCTAIIEELEDFIKLRHPVGEIELSAAFCYELQTSGKSRPQRIPTSFDVPTSDGSLPKANQTMCSAITISTCNSVLSEHHTCG